MIQDNTARTRIKENLVTLMQQHGITQAELARQTGESDARISYYRSGKKLPSIAVASRIAEVLGCSIDDLLK